MKLFSIFNKPDSKLNNKQKGQTFMELVIILLIAGTAVICIIWYFYWVLQSSAIDLKYKLEDVRTAMASQCGLPKPAGEQPSTIEPISDEFPADDEIYSFIVPYADQNVEVKNNGPSQILFGVYINGNGYAELIASGNTWSIPITQTRTSNSEYETRFKATTLFGGTATYTVTITPI